jgi:hypothetical protein
VLRVKHRTVLKWAKTGQIPRHRLSGSKPVTWRFLKSELDAMLSVRSAAEASPISSDHFSALIQLFKQNARRYLRPIDALRLHGLNGYSRTARRSADAIVKLLDSGTLL